MSKKRKIILTDKLSHGLKIVHAAVTQKMEDEEALLISEFNAWLESENSDFNHV